MAYDHEEQEQFEALKAFWNRHGNTIMTVVTVVLLVIAGWRGWNWYESHRAVRASVVYHQLRVAAETGDAERVRSAAQALRDDFSGTAYARMGALMAAHTQVETAGAAGAADGSGSAEAGLRWVIDKGGDEIFVAVSRLRLASLLIDDQAWDEAERVLAVEPPPAFAGLYADRRGDLASARGQKDEARRLYQQALATLGPAVAVTRVVQLKLDALGSGS